MPTKRPVLQFLGAARSVTGSKFLLDVHGQQVLFECGLFQGLKKLRRRNWDPLPINPKKVDAVVLTHAHIDHSGALPRLVKQGYRGKIWCTPPTRDLLGLLLPDSGYLQEEEARYANKKGYSKHRPALPLYDKEEAIASLRQAKSLRYGKEREIVPGITVKLHPSGHILGAAFIEVMLEDCRIVISGDIGGYDKIVMNEPSPIPEGTDYVLVESTYGGRVENHRPVQEQMREAMAPTLENGGVVVIPAFAVGRTTLVMYHVRELQQRGELPMCPVFVDSPMATDAVELYVKYGDEHNLRVDMLKDSRDCPIRARNTRLTRTTAESKQINDVDGPAIIISASGMATGGRILHHLRHRLPDENNLILLVGYQAEGTRGRALLEGKDQVKMHGQYVPVRAAVASIRGLSAHGDSDDIIRWLKTAKTPPKTTFLVHGEPEGLDAMAERVKNELGWKHHIPDYMDEVTLWSEGPAANDPAAEIERLEDELEKIDAAWVRQRAALLASDDGETTVPTMLEAVLIAVLGGGFGVGMSVMLWPQPFWVGGFVVAIGATAFAAFTAARAARYERAEAAWRAKRDPLQHRLDVLDGKAPRDGQSPSSPSSSPST